jgi:hypothetical protein
MLTLLTSSIILAVAYLAIVATLAIVAALRSGGRREDASEEHDALAVSRFTIPVSIIVPISKGTTAIGQVLSALLDLNYPEFEIIVVTDGAPKSLVDELARDWQLEAREFFYRKIIDTSEVRRIYRSGRDPRLMVIDKAAAGYSDAVNCGVNVARYRYFMPVEPEVTFDRDALLRLMTAALRDPANVVGASNHVERGTLSAGDALPPSLAVRFKASFGETRRSLGEGGQGVPTLSALFQRLASARSLMDSRLAWRHLGAGLGPAGAVTVWRKDAIIKLNGFSADAADSDLDMMLRLQSRGIEGHGRFDRGPDVFGRAGSHTLRVAFYLAGRRQLAALEILAAWARGRARGFEPKALAYFVGSEFMTPLAQTWIVFATAVGAVVGWFSWSAVVLAIVLLSFGSAAVTNGALLLRGSAAGAPDEPELQRLLMVGPLDFLCYRSVLAAARLVAVARFVTGTAKRLPAIN